MITRRFYLILIILLSIIRSAFAVDFEFFVPIEIDKIYPNVTPVVRCGVYQSGPTGKMLGEGYVDAKRGVPQKTTIIVPVTLKAGYNRSQARNYSCELRGRLDSGKTDIPKPQHISLNDEFKGKQGSLLRVQVKGLLNIP